MSRGLQYLAAWSASTAVAVALSWLGIKSVLEAGVPERPVLVASPAQSTAAPTTTTTTTATTAPPTTAPPAVVETAARTTTTTTTTTEPKPTATTNPLPSEMGTWSAQDGERVYLRSFQLEGGVAAIRFSPTTMEPISVSPRQNFSVNIEQPAHAVVVVFNGPDHRSILEAMWLDDAPLWRIREEG